MGLTRARMRHGMCSARAWALGWPAAWAARWRAAMQAIGETAFLASAVAGARATVGRDVPRALSDVIARAVRGEPWRAAAGAFVLSRAVIIVVSFIAAMTWGTGLGQLPPTLAAAGTGWYHYDANIFAAIARNGYGTPVYWNTAFFPLWPLLMHLGGSLFGGSLTAYFWAGLVLANLCFFLALGLFYELLRLDFGADVAWRGILYLALYPYALFFFAGYSEALFLLLALGLFLALRRQTAQRWWLAGGLGGLLALTRAVGVLAVVPFIVLAYQRCWAINAPLRQRVGRMARALAPALLVPLGTGVYMLYLGVSRGNPLLFAAMERQKWGRHLAPPWLGVARAAHGLLIGSAPSLNAPDLVFTLLPLAALALGWKRLPLHYRLFAASLALLALAEPLQGPEPLASMPRYLMAAFPIFVVCALWGRSPWFDRAYLALAPALLALNVVLFTTHHWVA